MKKYKLMIKQHKKTLKKYMCITSRENYIDYTGSGTKWKRHLQKHGVHFDTILLFESTDYNEFQKMCEKYSNDYDVVNSPEFLNVVPEHGYDSGCGLSNLEVWWSVANNYQKELCILKRNKSIKKYWEQLSDEDRNNRISKMRFVPVQHSEQTKKHISESLKKFYASESIESINCRQNAINGLKSFMGNKDSEEYKKWHSSVTESLRNRRENMTEEDRKRISESISNARLNLSQEKKEERAKKIREVYKSGKHDEMFKRMSEERKGTNNPNAKIIIFSGKSFTKGDFSKYCKDQGITPKDVERMIKNGEIEYQFDDSDVIYEEVFCPHCKKSSGGKKPSSFKRWHFDKCKQRND